MILFIPAQLTVVEQCIWPHRCFKAAGPQRLPRSRNSPLRLAMSRFDKDMDSYGDDHYSQDYNPILVHGEMMKVSAWMELVVQRGILRRRWYKEAVA